MIVLRSTSDKSLKIFLVLFVKFLLYGLRCLIKSPQLRKIDLVRVIANLKK